MVMTIEARNVNAAFYTALLRMRISGERKDSRNGDVIKYPSPVVTTYRVPEERILWDPVRDVNSVFHLFESLWMLAGQDKVDPLLPFNARMREFAEEDGTIHGAYGERWIWAFGYNQIRAACHKLQQNPNDRRVVIQMWDATTDNFGSFKDVPCNTHIYFNTDVAGNLDMTVCCRSNDLVWGAYGANAVHMSILHELVARGAGLPIGKYNQFSNDFHIYPGMPNFEGIWKLYEGYQDEYRWSDSAEVIPLLSHNETVDDFCEDAIRIVLGLPAKYTSFCMDIAAPLIEAYRVRRDGGSWRTMLKDVKDCDWKLSFQQWAERREK